jgi:hypothetical protein
MEVVSTTLVISGAYPIVERSSAPPHPGMPTRSRAATLCGTPMARHSPTSIRQRIIDFDTALENIDEVAGLLPAR